MIQNVLRDIGGVGIYGVISISLFFLVFVGALVWVWLVKKETADAIAVLPLEDGARPSAAAESPDSLGIAGSCRAARRPDRSDPEGARTPRIPSIAATKGDGRHE